MISCYITIIEQLSSGLISDTDLSVWLLAWHGRVALQGLLAWHGRVALQDLVAFIVNFKVYLVLLLGLVAKNGLASLVVTLLLKHIWLFADISCPFDCFLLMFFLITAINLIFLVPLLFWMTTVIGVTCLYSMIYLPAYLHLCESAEALGSGVAYYRLSRT